MSDVLSGIETVEEGGVSDHDVNTDAGFTASIAEKLGKEIPEGTEFGPSTDIASGLSYEDERPRDAGGRFAARSDEQPETQVVEPVVAAEPAAQQEAQLPTETPEERIARLEKMVEDSQSMIGRLGNELGTARQQAQQAPQVPASLPVVSQEEADSVFGFVEEQGFDTAMNWILQNNRFDLHDVVLDAAEALAEGDPQIRRRVQDYRVNLAVEQRLMSQGQPQSADPYVQQLKQKDVMNQSLTKVRAETPDFDQLQNHLKTVIEGNTLLQQLVASSDPSQVEQGIQLATGVARGYAAQELAAAAARQAQAGQGQRQAQKQAAQVATGSFRVGTGGQAGAGDPTPEQTAERVAAFKQAIMEAPGTSVADGLTYG